MNNVVKCRFCKKEIEKENAYSPMVRQYFCNEEHYQMQLNKDKYKPKRVKPNGDANERRELTDLIQEYYIENGYDKHFINWQLESQRIKNILEENKEWRLTGLTYTLRYMHDILNVDLFNERANCVMALVPFYYNEALRYYNKIQDIEDSVNSFEFNDEINIVKPNIKKKYYKRINIQDI